MVQSVTDARGITTTFGYNSRHSLTSITYPVAQNLPLGIPSTANVSYGYDAVGNRTSMADASGNIVNYNYDSLSRLTSEARQFAGLSGTYTLAYEYTLAGQVKTVADQSPGAGTSYSYTLDNVGRLSSVTSTGLGATAPLASNAQYRASGALKHREYGNGTGMNLAYNNRGMIAQYELSGVKETNGAARAEGSDFQYYADGQVKFASDLYGRSFDSMSFHDKSYQHDQVGRLQKALSGVEANDFLNNTNSGPFHGPAPYLQTSSYDAWSNRVSRTGTYWSEDNIVEPQTYDAHNRNTAWSYDADGRLISMNEPPFNEHPFVPAIHTYDAAGRHVKHTQTTSRVSPFPGNPVHTTITTIDAGYDGDGQQVKRVGTTQINSQQPVSGPGYYLRSSVLGGQVITEIDAQGGRFKSHVYGGGALIASTNAAGLVWRFNNPVTGDGRETDAQGKLVAAAYLDPDGMDVGATDPASAPSDPEPPTLPMAGAYGSLFPGGMGGSGSCIVDGIEMGCGFANSLMAMGAADQCPDNYCGPRAIYDNRSQRYVGVLPLTRNPNTGGFMVTGTVDNYSQYGGRVVDPSDGTVIQSSAGEWTKDGIVDVAFSFNPQNSSTSVYEFCRELIFGPGDSFMKKDIPDEGMTNLLLAAGGTINDSAFAASLVAKESNFIWRPDKDHGPAQLTSWWKNNHPDLIIDGAYDPFPRPDSGPNAKNRDRTFTGSPTNNIMTLGNIVRFQRKHHAGNEYLMAKTYYSGPGDQDAYAKEVLGRYEAYKPFFKCLGAR